MRLLVIATDVWGRFGGIAQYNRDLLEALADDDRVQSIHVLSLNPCSPAKSAKFKVQHADGNKLAFAAMCLAHSVLHAPGIILCAHINFMGLARIMKRVSGRPVWLQIHGIDAWSRPSRSREQACRQADLVTVVSRYTRQRFLAWAGLEPERVRVIPNTVQPRFQPGPRSAPFRCALGIDPTAAPMLLTVSRLSRFDKYKGVDKVIAALAKVRERFPRATYCIAGDGDDVDRLRSEATKHGVGDFVTFLGPVGEDRLVQLYREADLFVMPSTKEGFGIVFLEAMASGTPALGLGIDGSIDALLEGKLGIVASTEHLPSDICAALDRTWSPASLSAETHARFGKAIFSENVTRVVSHIQTAFPEHARL